MNDDNHAQDQQQLSVIDAAKVVAALWVSDYVPLSGQDWGHYHLRDQWPEMCEALNKLASSVDTSEELATWDRLVGDPRRARP